MNLETRLDRHISKHLRQFRKDSVERVREFVHYEYEHPEKPKPYRFFESIEDFTLYKNLHPEWDGYSTTDMVVDRKSGANSFYVAFYKWVRKQAGDVVERRELRERIFPARHRDYSFFRTIDDWVVEFKKHKEWSYYAANDAKNDTKSGANAFYQAFKKWVRKQADDVVERRVLVERIFPARLRDYSSFRTIDDWVAEFKKHEEWRGYSTSDVIEERTSGAGSFYDGLHRWVSRQTNVPAERRALKQQVFPARYNDYSSFKTIDDWVAEFKKHEEWTGYSTKDMKDDKESGARFYAGLRRWVNKQTNVPAERRALMQQVFPARYNDHSSFKTIDDWVAEFKKHGKWRGYSQNDMTHDSQSGASKFYGILRGWVLKQTNVPAERIALMQQVFPSRYNDYSSFKTIDDWVAEFKRHKEWRGYSINDMREDMPGGASKFYQGLGKWIRKQTEYPAKRKKLIRKNFPERLAPFPYNTGGEIVYFGSRPERIVGLLLNQYGLLSSFREGKNVHVRTNGHKAHSLDFLVGKTFIEYHPFGFGDHKNGMKDIGTVARKRIGNITNLAFKDYKFYMITDMNQVYDLLHMPEIRPLVDRKMKQLSREQFNEELRHAYARAGSYDNKHLELFKN